MKLTAPVIENLGVLVIGSIDFQRRMTAALSTLDTKIDSAMCANTDAWAEVLARKPECIILELGLRYNSTEHSWAKDFLAQLRSRFGNAIYVTIAIMAPEKLFYAGDLLFAEPDSLEPSGYVDTFMAQAPAGFPSVANIAEQTVQMLRLVSTELTRRDAGLPATPPLAADGWVYSLADPISRELWMLWLPRYASYTNENPIITGPTGAGKTRLAKALHILSGRKGPFISITPRDFSSSELIQAELFGAVAGAYTGAVDKWGMVKSAENGTLFIDELQSIDKDLQGKLITFIENKSYRRVGSADTVEANVRFVFATNRAIPELVENDTLRDDFAYRLERVRLDLPALRARRLDISAGLGFALAKVRRQRPQMNSIVGVTSAAYRILFGLRWPGNLRQLENAVAQLCELADINGQDLISDDIVSEIFSSDDISVIAEPAELISVAASQLAKSSLSDKIECLDDGVVSLKELARRSALESCAGNIDKAAALVGESPKTMELFSSGQRTKEMRRIFGEGDNNHEDG